MEEKKKEEKKHRYVIFTVCLILYFLCFIVQMNNLDMGEEEYLLVIINIIYIISCGISILYIRNEYKKSLKKVNEYDYYRDIDFKNVNAVSAGILLKTANVNINTVITAIYELAEKKIVKIDWKEQKNYLTLIEHDKEKIRKLLNYEKKILHYIFKNLQDTNQYCLEDILKKAKNDATQNYILKDIEKEIKIYVNQKYYTNFADYMAKNNHFNITKDCSMLCVIIFCFGIFPCIMGWARGIILPSILLITEYIINLILVIYYSKGKLLKKRYQDEVQKLYGLYAYMSDYTILNEQELKFYQLYNTYYLYAMGLGVADKFEKELEQGTLDNEVRTVLQFYFQNKEEIS